MDSKLRWVFGFLLSFVFLGVIINLFIRDTPHGSHQYSLFGDLKNTILDTVDGAWSWRTKPHKHSTLSPTYAPLSPNLSTCHMSTSRGTLDVYCCPPEPESDEPFIDFHFPDQSAPLRIRRPAHNLTQDSIAKYKKGIAMMKSLSFNDPRNFKRQANIHCIFCTGAYNQMYSNAALNVHRSWLFFPFHRMMIYFHERIIGNLIGDDTFALPFWNWDNPEGMFIPDFYMNGSFVDSNRDRSHLPPRVADIDFSGVETGLNVNGQIESNLAFMYHQMVSGAKRTELFMGCTYRAGAHGACDGPGTIELAPHNALHTWVGSNLNPQRENMGSFYSAARDPIFYAHHSNIDRLWEVWRELNEHKLDIHDKEWLDSYFFFHNEKSQLVRIRIRDVLDISKLRYAYERVENPWVNAKPKPSIPPKIAKQMLKNGSHYQGPTTQDFGPDGKRLENSIRVRVQRPRKQREEEEEVLVVYGIDVKKDAFVKFDVFVNAVNESNIGPESREFAGTFVNMQKGVKLVMREGDVVVKRKTVLKLGISELLEELEADGDESVWVTLVPRGGTGVNAAVGGVRIEFIP